MRLPSRRIIILALNIVIVVPLLIYAFATIYARFMADDFCDYDTFPAWGIPNTIAAYYIRWSGRIVHIASIGVLHFVSSQAQSAIAIGFLIVWWLAIFLLVRLLATRRELPDAAAWSALAASLLLLTTLTGSANIFHTIYWQQAIVTFQMPLVLLTLFAWVVLQDWLNTAFSLILCAVLPFLAGGYAEVYALLQTILIVVAYFVYARQRPQFQRLLVGFAFSLAILLIVVLAPGSSNRQNIAYPPPNIAATIKNTLSSPAIPLILSVEFSPFNCLALVFLPGLAAYYYDKKPARQARLYLLIVLLTVLAASAATFAVAYYATSNVLPARALIEPQYVTLFGLAAGGYLFGLSLRRMGRQVVMPQRLAVAGAVILLAAACLSSLQALTTTAQLRTFSQAWDQRDAEIKAFREAHPGSSDIVNVTYIPNRFDVDEIGPDVNAWQNKCAATYYKVAGLVATPPPH